MKKLFIKLLTFTFTLSLFANTAYASTNVVPRTEDNLMVNPRIELTDQRVSDIMNTPKVDASEKVYDFADLLSPSEEEILYERVNQFVMNANLDLALVTISDNNKYSEVEYADDFYDYNDFGTDDNCSGMLFLIDMENRRIWISTTGQAILMYDDYRIEGLLDSIYTGVSSEKYYDAFDLGITRAEAYFHSGYPDSNSNYYIDENGDYISSHDMYVRTTPLSERIFNAIGSGFGIGFWGAVIFFIIGLVKSKNPKLSSTAREYLVKDSFKLNESKDDFVTTVTTSVKIESSSSGGGGSSTHSGGSGISHGGGGRSF